ncbi:hypothetical protein EAG_12035 [Camponotus floridanus]|uniref:Uncharacterized protein n=1 Tax=Camponotus floridanus TaxID=104421 RepID=E1ZXH6_CAMFO|nr:hypothetical protein EAG_12035 [Camponotus floridanus]
MKEKHINDVQTSTVDEHLKLILEDDSINDPSSDVTSNDLPHWYDKQLYKKAQNFYNRNLFGITIADIVGVIAIFSITSILKVLLYTKQSSIPCAAFKRYVETHLHIQNIYTSDANNTDSNWYKSINVIRWKHKTNSDRSKNAGVGPIYQRDMVLTQFCFVGYILMTPKYFGIRSEPIEDEAFNHFWRVNGYMLGIPDNLNICRKTAAETRELCQKIVKTVFMNSLNQVSFDFDHTVSTIINSLWYIDLDLNKDHLLILTYQVHGTECKYSMFILIKYIILLKSFLRIITEDNSPFLLFKYLYFLKINILYM